MIISSTRFGQIDVSDDQVTQFPFGLPGFPEEKQFVILPYKPDSPFYFLQSLKDCDLSFLAVNPFDFFSDYEFKIEEEITEAMGFSQETLPEVYAIITVPQQTEDMTANLLAPIVINRAKQMGMQLILEKTAYTTRHRLFPAKENKEAGEGGK